MAQFDKTQANKKIRQRQPNENPKDYMLATYTGLELVFDVNAATSIYRMAPYVKYLCAWKTEVNAEEIPAIQGRTNWRHPNLVSFLFFDEIQELNKRTLRIFYEYLALDARQLLEKRALTKSYIPESEILKLLQGVGSAMQFLQRRGVNHGALQLESLYFDEEYLLYRIQDISPFRAKAPQLFKNPYWAPELLTSIQHNKFKVDVFSLGIIAISLLLLRDAAPIFKGNQVNKLQLDALIKEVQSIYSDELTNIIQQMIAFDSEQRLDWQELLARVEEMTKQQTKIVRSASNGGIKQEQAKPDLEEPKMIESRRNTETRMKNQAPQKSNTVKLDQKLQMLNAKIQETLAKSSQNKYLRS